MENLRKVGIKENVVNLKEVVALEKELNRRLLQADMDVWYDSIKEHTFESVFLPISTADAELMMLIHSKNKKGEKLDPQTQELYNNLKARVEEGLVALSTDGSGVFAKLSSRSPKDATNRLEAKRAILSSILAKKRSIEGSPLCRNSFTAAIFQAHISSYRLYTAEEVLTTLLSSERVINDELPLALEHKNRIWKEHIVLRKWYDIPIEFEFRGFVYDNKLTGLCQYYSEILFPVLVENKQKIQTLVLDFFELIKDKLPIEPKEYVIDFVVDIEKNRVLVVEINPFGKPDGMGTGQVMFYLDPAYNKPHDYKVLFGEADFEFRIETKALRDDEAVSKRFKNWIASVEAFECGSK